MTFLKEQNIFFNSQFKTAPGCQSKKLNSEFKIKLKFLQLKLPLK